MLFVHLRRAPHGLVIQRLSNLTKLFDCFSFQLFVGMRHDCLQDIFLTASARRTQWLDISGILSEGDHDDLSL